MSQTVILYPSIAMFFLTFGVIGFMGYSRYTGIKNGSVSIKFFRTYNEGEQPQRLHLIGRHIQNHFEVPPLFHLGVIATYASDSVTVFGLAFAWLYFLGRCVHSFIHLGSNNVSARFFTFGATMLFLGGLWGSLFVILL